MTSVARSLIRQSEPAKHIVTAWPARVYHLGRSPLKEQRCVVSGTRSL